MKIVKNFRHIGIVTDNLNKSIKFYQNILGLKPKVIMNEKGKITEKKINLKKANFNSKKIGNLVTEINFVENNGIIKFHSKNELNINNHIEFAKVFQVGSKKVKNIEKIYFDLEKNMGESDYIITNVKINNIENKEKMKEIFLIKNVQNLRANIRKVID